MFGFKFGGTIPSSGFESENMTLGGIGKGHEPIMQHYQQERACNFEVEVSFFLLEFVQMGMYGKHYKEEDSKANSLKSVIFSVDKLIDFKELA